jgi:DNA-binding response OmpR family regulator
MDILVVEDELLIAIAIEDVLTDAGHRVHGPARTAGEALALAAVVKPDLALLNINLADEHKGTDLARVLLAEHGIPALFVSGNIHEARAAQDAALGFICKPCSPEVLLQSVTIAEAIVSGTPFDARHIPPGLTLSRRRQLPEGAIVFAPFVA